MVPCRSNGDVALNVHHPTVASSGKEATPRVLIYLPRGPLWGDQWQEAANVSLLSQHLPAHHLVQINYRLSRRHQYPTPIHDTLAGLDWIIQNILPKRALSRPGRAHHVGKIAVCGELIGGGLAAVLGLTECRVSEPGIMAVASGNPVLDWVSHAKDGPLDAVSGDGGSAVPELLAVKDLVFARADGPFDPFASPILLFRTAGVDVPPAPANVALDEMTELGLLEREEYADRQASSHIQQKQDAQILPDQPVALRKRRSSRRYPSPSLTIRLPDFHISSGNYQPFLGQATELAVALRQSFVRQSRQSATGFSFGHKFLLDDEEDEHEGDDEKHLRQQQRANAAKKAQLHSAQDLGLWDDSREGQQRLENVAMWLKESMR